MVTLTAPLIALVLGVTAIPMEVRPFEFSAISLKAGVFDLAANFVGYIPVGVVLANLKCSRAVAIATLVSLVAETCQFFMMFRFPSPTDLTLNVAGAMTAWLACRRWRIRVPAIRVTTRAARLSLSLALAIPAILGVKAWWNWRESYWGELAVNSRGAISTGTLEAHWKFDRLVGGVVSDSSGNEMEGTLVGDAALQDGIHGAAVSLGAEGDFVDFGNPVQLRLMGSMTICAWTKATSFPPDDAAIVSTLYPGYQLDTTVDRGQRTVAFKLVDPCGNLMIRYGTTTLARDTWYHMAGVYDADGRKLNVYLNGQLDNGFLLGTVTTAQHASSQRVYVGRRPNPEGYGFSGQIDDVRIYSRALTQADIELAMNGIAIADEAPRSVASVPASLILEKRQPDCRRPSRSDDALTPGLIVAAGLLSAIAATRFWPARRMSCLFAALAVGMAFLPTAPMTLPAYDLWMIPILSLIGGASVSVSRIVTRSAANLE